MELSNLAPPAPPQEKEYNPKLIKSGNLIISSVNIESTKNTIYSFVKTCNGYVTQENLVSNDPSSYYKISLNIDASKYERFIYLLDSAKLNIVNRSFSVEDVTMQYIDNSTRLENKRKLEKRYLDLLSKTKDIKDMLEIEEKLESIRTEIEVKEAQLKAMDKQIAYSAFDITITRASSNLTLSEKNKYSHKLGQGIYAGWEALKQFVIILFSLWPLYLVLVIIYLVFRKLKKSKKE
jgi:hypothetical protein